MVERVARKLCERAIRIARKWDTPADELEANLPAGVEHAWRDYADEARTAIEAMRTPTEAMIAHALDQFDWGPSGYFNAPGGAASPDDVFSAMIDAALNTPPPAATEG